MLKRLRRAPTQVDSGTLLLSTAATVTGDDVPGGIVKNSRGLILDLGLVHKNAGFGLRPGLWKSDERKQGALAGNFSSTLPSTLEAGYAVI